MELKQKMVFDVVERPEGLALVLRGVPRKLIFFKENPEDGSLEITDIIQEPSRPKILQRTQ